MRLLRLGGHFPGSAVLHWSAGAAGKGVLCTGDASLPVYSGSRPHDVPTSERRFGWGRVLINSHSSCDRGPSSSMLEPLPSHWLIG